MNRSVLVKKYFEEQKFVESNIKSFNNFIEKGMQEVVDDTKEVEPAIIPHNIEKFKIKFGKIKIGYPEITEADGSRRRIFPMEARLRKLTYSALVMLEVSTYINDVQRESFTAEIGRIPIMLKSKYCNLSGLNKEDLTKKGEDPFDPGGYFIINGTEKVVVTVEDLASNIFSVDKSPKGYKGRIFSAKGSYKIPHDFEKGKDGLYCISFTRVKKIPIIVIIKALGLLKDEEIMRLVSGERDYEEILLNFYGFVDMKTQEETLDYVARKSGMTQIKEVRVERIKEMLDKYLLPHIGIEPKDRIIKAKNLCKMLKKFLEVERGLRDPDDKDHYSNKRLRMSGNLLIDLFRVNFKILVGDILYNFQRIIKRGKLPTIRVIIREKLLTQRIYSSMATGQWVGERQGISQRMDRTNFLAMLSHLQRVVSPLTSSQENFEARALHCTHIGRLCPIETPEGTNIGLRKNLALLCSVSQEVDEKEVLEKIKEAGLKE